MDQTYRLLHQIGIKRTYHGYYHLASAIHLAAEKEERLTHLYKYIYQEVAAVHQTSPFCVERNIRTVKIQCCNKDTLCILESISGYPIQTLPSNLEFIDILSSHIKSKSHSSYF